MYNKPNWSIYNCFLYVTSGRSSKQTGLYCVFMSDFQVSGSSMAFSKASWQLISANKEPLAVKHLIRLSNRKKNTRSIFVPRQVCKRNIGKLMSHPFNRNIFSSNLPRYTVRPMLESEL